MTAGQQRPSEKCPQMLAVSMNITNIDLFAGVVTVLIKHDDSGKQIF